METKSASSNPKAKQLAKRKSAPLSKTIVWKTYLQDGQHTDDHTAAVKQRLIDIKKHDLMHYLEIASNAAIEQKAQLIDYVYFTKIFEGKLTELEIGNVIFAKELNNAIKKKKQFNSQESDRANRLARIVELSERVFGNTEKSSRWLRKPRVKLSGQSPLELIATDAGTAVVEEMLHRIDHGMFA